MADGFCECGCGGVTPIAKINRRGYRKGESMRFVHGHGRFVPIIDRLFAGIDVGTSPSSCWVPPYATDNLGYKWIQYEGRMQPAHRVAYKLLVGPIPEGMQLDHLCRNPSCVNPLHVEPVTPRENLLRGTGWAGRQHRKTHCVNGHALTGDNVYYRSAAGNLTRRCRICTLELNRAYRKRRREQAA